jgi:uncharacterized membrane protein
VETQVPGIPSGVEAFLSRDGAVVGSQTTVLDPVTNVNVRHASYWTKTGGWVDIGGPTGATPCGSALTSVKGLNSDGTVIVGASQTPGKSCYYGAYQWRKGTGFEVLPGLFSPASKSMVANAVSADGSIVAGWESDNSSGTRYPRHWDAGGAAHAIGTGEGESQNVSSDGKYITGRSMAGAWIYTVATGVYNNIWKFNYTSAIAVDISADGNTVVGYHEDCPIGGCYITGPFAWTASGGMVDLGTYLAGKNVPVPADTSSLIVHAMSADATSFVGEGGASLGWIAASRQ